MYQSARNVLLVDMNPWPARIGRALSLRVIFFSLLAGIGLGVCVGIVWPAATMTAVWLIAAACYLLAVFNDGQMLKCAACGKRVKLGAATCHHCGYTAT